MSEQIDKWEADGRRWYLVTEMPNDVVVGFELSDADFKGERTELARGSVKWDGCSDTTVGKKVMWHGCGVGTFQILARALDHVYGICVERLGDMWHEAK